MRRHRLFVPEVVQTSSMDCGPACLKSLLEGFGISVSYDRLRDICQTDVDGTSIDTLEQVAGDLGLDAEQIMVPVDHLFVPGAHTLPAIVVVRLPGGLTHFVVVWSQLGGRVQVMDPASGRRWVPIAEFANLVHVHGQVISASDWREWAESPEFLSVLRSRARRMKVAEDAVSEAIDRALQNPGWRDIGAVDAALRMLQPVLKEARLNAAGNGRLLRQFLEKARLAESPFQVIPPRYWPVLPVRSQPGQEEQLLFRGAVLLRVRRRKSPENRPAAESARAAHLSKAVQTAPVHALPQLMRLLRADGVLVPATLAGALVVSSCGVVLEGLLFRAFVDLPSTLVLAQQRFSALGMLIAFSAVLLLLNLCTMRGVLRAGRRLELRLRAHLLHAIPRLSDRYFGSRLISDMAERSHSIHEIRGAPMIGAQLVQSTFALCFTVAGIAWLDFQSGILALVCALAAICAPLVTQPLLAERDLCFRTHAGALCRFYLDALRGLVPARAHAAEDAIRAEHEGLLVSWTGAGLRLQTAATALDTAVNCINLGLVACMVIGHVLRHQNSGAVLLLVFWALNVPMLGAQIARLAWQYPRQRNLALRLLEPLGSVEEVASQPAAEAHIHVAAPSAASAAGMPVVLENVTVRAMGRTILSDCNLKIEPGSHVCVVGPSGAGKSTLIGLLLGWYQPSTGILTVDGQELREPHLDSVRRQTAWVDPSIQIWNRSLLENLQYGRTSNGSTARLSNVLESANLLQLLETLPEGMQARLGESGALVSGGEGQRVRLARAMLRDAPRLVLLDEPFTNLDRSQRRDLLRRARELWKKATLLCVTHDVSESRFFERVLVLDGGRIVEDGSPAELACRPGSVYARLLEAEQGVRERLWSAQAWRRLWMERGTIREGYSDAYDESDSEHLLARHAARRSAGGTGQDCQDPAQIR